ncbi:hypothetical protein PW5551_06150 [Petrotoga sp. 9PW.55.5.1]|uniref:hypothetical protein n=1 Tax=Petrotoga sp. 9PW.55.5.1 TaxID=1308979 RepID=UPI000DC5103E|nr:hypothetical protein [Petrotoga sp. 9PW.55.5.1]RAO99095.1 hypothetical protein PW5551_06150 [Petrotoga sp. 9PW.55.5.1]
MRKKYLYILLGFSLLFVLSGCMMNLLDIILDPGIYLGYSKNNNVPTVGDQLKYDGNLEFYKITINVSDLTYSQVDEDGVIYDLSYYKVFNVKEDGNVVSDSIPIWKDVVEENELETITIYADPSKMKENLAVGVGDSSRYYVDWYFAGNWGSDTWDAGAVKFEELEGILVANIEKDFNAGDTISYKIKPSSDWRPWNMIFNSEVYSRDSSDAVYTLKSNTNQITVYFDPRISYVWFEESEVN